MTLLIFNIIIGVLNACFFTVFYYLTKRRHALAMTQQHIDGFKSGQEVGATWVFEMDVREYARLRIKHENDTVIVREEDGACQQCVTTCVSCSAEECFKNDLASLKCVQAGWAFGVPEDGRDQWLDLVVKLMRKYI